MRAKAFTLMLRQAQYDLLLILNKKALVFLKTRAFRNYAFIAKPSSLLQAFSFYFQHKLHRPRLLLTG